MFHLNLWKVLSDVASAQCNARVYLVTFLLERRKATYEHGESQETSAAVERPSR
jgi:hypothetical protein